MMPHNWFWDPYCSSKSPLWSISEGVNFFRIPSHEGQKGGIKKRGYKKKFLRRITVYCASIYRCAQDGIFEIFWSRDFLKILVPGFFGPGISLFWKSRDFLVPGFFENKNPGIFGPGIFWSRDYLGISQEYPDTYKSSHRLQFLILL